MLRTTSSCHGACSHASSCRSDRPSAAALAGCGRAPGSDFFLVDRQHYRVLRWVEIEADDVGRLLGEPRITRALEAALPVRLELTRRQVRCTERAICRQPWPSPDRSNASSRAVALHRSAPPRASPFRPRSLLSGAHRKRLEAIASDRNLMAQTVCVFGDFPGVSVLSRSSPSGRPSAKRCSSARPSGD